MPGVEDPNKELAPESLDAAGANEATRSIRERQERDYHRYVKAYRDYHEHSETSRDWLVGGVRIRASDAACAHCASAASRIYDADSLPRLPLATCEGDGEGFCDCGYVVVLSRSSAVAMPVTAIEVAPQLQTATGGVSVIPGICTTCGSVLSSESAACKVCSGASQASAAQGLPAERPSLQGTALAEQSAGRGNWLQQLLKHGKPAVPAGAPGAKGASGMEALRTASRVRIKNRQWARPLLKPMERAAYKLTKRWHRRTITVSTENGIIRAVAFKGRDVVAWGCTKSQEEPELANKRWFPPQNGTWRPWWKCWTRWMSAEASLGRDYPATWLPCKRCWNS